MKLTNIAAVLLGCLPIIQSLDSRSLSALSLETDDLSDYFDSAFELEETEWEDSNSIRFLPRRVAETTLSQQCIDDQAEIGSDPGNNFTMRMYDAGCHFEDFTMDNTTGTITLYNSRNTSLCPDLAAEYRAFCDENYQTIELRSFKQSCTTAVMWDNVTQEILPIIMEFMFIDEFFCEALSCPSDPYDYTAEDYNFLMELSITESDGFFGGASCVFEFLDDTIAEDDSGAEDASGAEEGSGAKEGSDAEEGSGAEEDSGANMVHFFPYASVAIFTAAMSLLI